jgi:gliding motility-associated-like protein
VLKWTSTGGHVWHKTFVGAGNQRAASINLDSDGNVIVGGFFEGALDFDRGTGVDMHTSLDQDAFAIKLDANGNYLWGRTLPSLTGGNAPRYSEVDGTDVYMFGSFFTTIDMDPGSGTFNLTSAGQSDSHLVKLNKDGDFQWALQMGGNFTDGMGAVGFDDAGNIYTGGWLFGTGDYDPGLNVFNLAPIGSSGASLVKLGAPSPTLTITTQPTSVNACEGSTASFTVAATGAANIQYHWQKYNELTFVFVDITDGGAHSGATTATLSVNTTGLTGLHHYQCRVSGDGVADIFSEEAELLIVTMLTPPTTTGTTRCGTGAIIVNASGATNGDYRWYTSPAGTAIIGEVNDSYTAAISATTTYYVSIIYGSCESTKTPVTATVNPLPVAPTVTNITRCTNATAELTASGGTAGGYRWYDVASGGSPVSITDSFITPALAATTTYYVTANNAGCESARTPLSITITSCANNQPPVIITSTSSTSIQGNVTVNLTPLLSDPDNNLDLTTLRIVIQPKSGATASIDQNGQLNINYSGNSFEGEDELTVEICDIAGSCVQQVIRIIVTGEIEVFNAVSPNGDGKNDVFHIAYIDMIEETRHNKVTIFNRWGDVVFTTDNYNNTTNVFEGKSNGGKELPSGTYFYRIEYQTGRKTETGYLLLKR